MGTKKISQLPLDSSPTTTDSIPSLDAETSLTKRATLASLISLFFNFNNIPADNLTGWAPLNSTLSVASGYNKGNKEFDLTSSSDLSGLLTPGMRLRVTRAIAPPTQCTDLEASSSQYANDTSVSGIVFTDDWTIEAWIKVESYGQITIASRYNGTSGFYFEIGSDGRLAMYGLNAGSANFRGVIASQSVPLNRWIHVAAVVDMSGFTTATNKIYIDGIDVPAAVAQGGTNPTALIQAGNLAIGSANSIRFFDGKMSDVRIWDARRTTTQIQDNMNQQLVGTETNLVGYWKLNGNFNDSTSNANNLAAQGGAVATDSDNPMRSIEYAIITKVTATIVTVFTGTDYNMPNMTLSTPYYSTHKAPFGFPATRTKWFVNALFGVQVNVTSNAAYGAYNSGGDALTVPTGPWIFGTDMPMYSSTTTAVEFALTSIDPTGLGVGTQLFEETYRITAAAASNTLHNITRRYPIDLSSATVYKLYSLGATTSAGVDSDDQLHQIIAECPYV